MVKLPIYCPRSIHEDRPPFGRRPDNKSCPKLLMVIDNNALYVYCWDRRCIKERSGTWLKVILEKGGLPVNFEGCTLHTVEMPKGYHFDLESEPMLNEENIDA